MIDSYSETRVVLAPSGELVLALPIYADVGNTILSPIEMEAFTGVNKVGIGVYEHFGYLMYHPSQQFSFYLKSIKLFEDLGKLDD